MNRPIFGRLAAFVLLTVTSLSGCDLLGDSDPDGTLVTEGVYIANQGNFGDANGSVSVYDPGSKAVTTALKDFGSIIQSISLNGSSIYVAANSANRVDVFDFATRALKSQITGVVSPRYLLVVNDRAYVTNLFGSVGSYTGGMVTILDVPGNKKVKEIQVGNNPEGLALIGNRLFVANHGFGAGTTLSVVDVPAQAVSNTVTLPCDGPRHIVIDEETELLVFCTGKTIYDQSYNPVGKTNGKVVVVDPVTLAIRKTVDLDGQILTEGPGQDVFFSPESREVYAVKDLQSVYRFNTSTNSLIGTMGPFADGNLSSVAYDFVNDRLYLGHTPSYAAPGKVTIHKSDGTKEHEFAVGVAPAFMSFSRRLDK